MPSYSFQRENLVIVDKRDGREWRWCQRPAHPVPRIDQFPVTKGKKKKSSGQSPDGASKGKHNVLCPGQPKPKLRHALLSSRTPPKASDCLRLPHSQSHQIVNQVTFVNNVIVQRSYRPEKWLLLAGALLKTARRRAMMTALVRDSGGRVQVPLLPRY